MKISSNFSQYFFKVFPNNQRKILAVHSKTFSKNFRILEFLKIFKMKRKICPASISNNFFESRHIFVNISQNFQKISSNFFINLLSPYFFKISPKFALNFFCKFHFQNFYIILLENFTNRYYYTKSLLSMLCKLFKKFS